MGNHRRKASLGAKCHRSRRTDQTWRHGRARHCPGHVLLRNMSKPSILAIIDKPGWSVDNQVSQVISGSPQFSWTKVFHRQPGDLAQAASKHDIIWCANHSSGPKFWKELEASKCSRILCTFRSWRYGEKAIPFMRSSMVHSVTAISPMLRDHIAAYRTPVHYVPDAVPDFFRPSRPRRIGF